MTDIHYINEASQLEDLKNWIFQHHTLGFDTETTSLDPLVSKILLIQIGNFSRQYVIDVAKIEKDKIQLFLNEINSPDLIKIFHNSAFDYMHIKSNYGVELNNIKCTMLGEQLLNQGKSKVGFSLENIVKKYLGETLNKSIRESFITTNFGDEFSQEQLKYSAEDVKYLVPVYAEIQKLLNERGMEELSLLEYETASVLGDMSLNGIYLDKEKWLPLEEKARIAVQKAKEKLDQHFKHFIENNKSLDLFGDVEYTINYNSPKQLLPRLREATGLDLTSTDAKYLEYYKDDYEIIADLINYRQEQKKITTYGSNFLDYIHKVDGRIHSKYRQLKAQTGRISSDDPNMMNLPKEQEYRTPFCVQNPDWNFISADFSGQELRLLAHISQEPEMISALKQKIDLHTYSASLLFNKSYDSITKHERNQCKTITFALLYGAGPKKLSTQLKISYEDAKELMDRYFKVFKNVKKFMDNIVSQVKQNKYAYSPLDGRRVYLDEIDWDNKAMVAHAINQAKNLPFQGGGASTIKLALVRLRNRIKKENYNAKIVNAIHDEILVEVCPEHTEDVKLAIQEEMIKAFNYYADSVPMEVDPKVGKHWIH